MRDDSIYQDGTYLRNSPTWHQEDSSWKAEQIARILARNAVHPSTIAEIGCGAGDVLRCLKMRLGESVECSGYDISPQAHALSFPKSTEGLRYVLADLLSDAPETRFDLALAIDVFEHVEDCFGFLRRLKPRAVFKVFHIPLDLSVSSIVRRNSLITVRESVGHLHYFTRETALRLLIDTGYDVVDTFYTAGSLDLPSRSLRARLMTFPRRIGFALNPGFTARFLGGCSLMVLAR